MLNGDVKDHPTNCVRKTRSLLKNLRQIGSVRDISDSVVEKRGKKRKKPIKTTTPPTFSRETLFS